MLNTATKSPFQMLGVSVFATDAEIKKAYFAKVKEHPPETDSEGFQAIRGAYDRLNTPEKRVTEAMNQVWVVPQETPLQSEEVEYNVAQTAIQLARAASIVNKQDWSEDFRKI